MADFLDFRMIEGPKDSKAENFEMLCAQLVELEVGDACRIRCNPGDKGIDILVGNVEDLSQVFQCKYFIDGVGKSQRDQIRESFWRVNSEFHPKKWTLCLPIDLSIDEQQWFQRFRRMYGSFDEKIDCWGETKLLNLLCKYPRIAEVYFAFETSKKISEIHAAVLQSPTQVDDRLALEWLRVFFDRPAFKDPFHLECSVEAFDKAMEDTIAAFNTGILRTREGQVIAKTKPRSMFTRRDWVAQLDRMAGILSSIRRNYAMAVRGGLIGKTRWGFGFLDLNSYQAKHLVRFMNDSRNEVLTILNNLLTEIGKEPLAMVEGDRGDGFIG